MTNERRHELAALVDDEVFGILAGDLEDYVAKEIANIASSAVLRHLPLPEDS